MPGKHQIEDDEVVGFRLGFGQADGPIEGQLHAAIDVFQMELHQFGDVFLILDNQNVVCHGQLAFRMGAASVA